MLYHMNYINPHELGTAEVAKTSDLWNTRRQHVQSAAQNRWARTTLEVCTFVDEPSTGQGATGEIA